MNGYLAAKAVAHVAPNQAICMRLRMAWSLALPR
jgi:hypothetical protein